MLKNQHPPRLRVNIDPMLHIRRMERCCSASQEVWGVLRRVGGDGEGLRRVMKIDMVGVEGALGAVFGFIGPVTVFYALSQVAILGHAMLFPTGE